MGEIKSFLVVKMKIMLHNIHFLDKSGEEIYLYLILSNEILLFLDMQIPSQLFGYKHLSDIL
jgi:hypothetical protein